MGEILVTHLILASNDLGSKSPMFRIIIKPIPKSLSIPG